MNIDHLLHQLAHQRTSNEYLYLLLDPLAGCDPEHPLSVAQLTGTLGKQAIERVHRADLANIEQDGPVLVQLASPGQPDSEYLRPSVRHALSEVGFNRRYVCGWQLSEQSIKGIAQHLAERCRVLSPMGGQLITPWFEPVRLELLHSLMDNISDVLWPLSAWVYPTACGTFSGIKGHPFSGGLVIPDSTYEMQQLAPHIIDVLSAWRSLNQTPPSYASMAWKGASSLPPDAAFHAYRLLTEACKRGLSNIDDLHCLCLHQVMIHPYLLDHPSIQQDIKHAVADEYRLASRFSAYDDHTWSEIVATLPQARSYS